MQPDIKNCIWVPEEIPIVPKRLHSGGKGYCQYPQIMLTDITVAETKKQIPEVADVSS